MDMHIGNVPESHSRGTRLGSRPVTECHDLGVFLLLFSSSLSQTEQIFHSL